MSKVRCKFTVFNIEHGVSNDIDEVNVRIDMQAAYAFDKGSDGNQIAENRDVFGKWTPSGNITMYVRKPQAVEMFEKGKSYYVDFTPVEE